MSSHCQIRKKNDVIRRLQGDLHQIQKFSEEHIKRTKSEAEKQEAADVKNSEGKKGKLQQEISQLRTQMQALTSEHRESEQTLRKASLALLCNVNFDIQRSKFNEALSDDMVSLDTCIQMLKYTIYTQYLLL